MKHPVIDDKKSKNQGTEAISQRKQVELALEASEKKYSDLVEKCNDGIVIIQDGLLKFANSKIAEISGYTKEEVFDKPFIDFISPDFKELVIERYQKRLSGRLVPDKYELEIISKNGTNIPVEINASIIDYEGRPADMGVIRDITVRKRTEKALERAIAKAEQEKRRSEAIVSAFGDGIIIQDTDYKITYQNQIQNEIFGEHLGEYCYKVYEGRDTICEDCPVELTFKDGNIHKSERTVPTKKGIKYFELTSSPLRDPSGKIIAGVKVVRDITELKHSEEGIRNSEEKYRNLYETMAQGVVYQDAYGKIISANPAAKRILGLTLDQMQGRTSFDPMWKAIHEDGSDFPGSTHPSMIALKTGKDMMDVVMGVFNPLKNEYTWININAIPQFKPGEEKPYQVYTTFEDITKQKLIEKSLLEKERFLASIFESIQDGIGIIDSEMNIVSVNRTAEKWYPHAAPLVGKKCYEAYHGRKERCEICPASQTIKTGKSAHEIVPKHGVGGKIIGWVEIYSYPMIDNTNGENIRIIEYVRDITERKGAEEKLKLFSEAIETAPDGVQIVDFNGKIVYSNKSVEQLYGFSHEELEGKFVGDLNADPEIAGNVILPALKEKGRWAGELMVKRKDGRMFPIWLSTSMVKNYKEEPIAMVGIIKDITERKESEKKLNESHAFLQSVINGVAEPILVIDKNYRVKLINQAARGGLYEVPDNLCCYQISHNSDKPCINSEHSCPLEEVRRTGRPVTVVHEHFKVNGKKRFYEILASPFYDSDGAFAGIVESSRDITERKHAEEALKASEKRYRMLFESAADAIFILEAEGENAGHIIAANHAAAEMHGFTNEELLNMKITDLDTPDASKNAPALIRRIMNGERIKKEITHQRKDGTVFPVEINAGLLELGNHMYILAFDRDITERKQWEMALEQSEEKFRNIVEQSGDGIVLTDEQGTIIEWNRAEEKIIGLNRADVVGRPIWDVQLQSAVPEKKTGEVYKKLKASLQELLKTGKSPILNRLSENDIMRPDGTRRGVQVQVFLIKTERGFKAGSITRDITERKKAEEAIRKYASDLEESNKMKELFTDIMHHDLLNPLNTVGGFIEILRDEEDNDRKNMYLQTIERNLAKGVELIESATTLSRLESLQNIEFENIDIAEVIGSNIENIRKEADKAGVQIENHITQCMPVRANKIIEQVFSNLFSNAIKYASNGKKIIVDSKETDGFWRVNVVDFGDGIKDSEKTLIFERFRRLEKKGVKGSGLGLAIARKILQLHNGRIWVEDNPEGGAIFVVEVPKYFLKSDIGHKIN